VPESRNADGRDFTIIPRRFHDESTMSGGPLAGVRVLDLTSIIMAPFATQILAGLGADVVKVEPPEGDYMRHVGPMRHPGMGHIFLHANRGKRSIVLDIKQPAACEALVRMAASVDVFITNVRPRVMTRLGLDHPALAARNARLIYVSCTGFGQHGPYAAKPAYDDLIQGAAGIPWLMEAYGAPEPCYAPVTLADRLTGLHAAYAVSAALYARERSGVGQLVEVPMFEAVTQFVLGDHMGGLTFDPPLGEAGYARLLTAYRRPYATRDGHLCALMYNDKQWRSFFAAIGDPGRFESDARFTTLASRAAHIAEVYAYVADVMRTRTTAEWRALLDAADIPNQPVNSLADLANDPHLRASGFIGTEEHPTEGPLRVMGNPTSWTGTPPGTLTPAPLLGEHTVELLSEAGFSERDIDALLKTGAAAQSTTPSAANPS
jgi:crotonobetainyl-CoA:carnitine CoA-transferase CaiB-like acyl-CoA transferase